MQDADKTITPPQDPAAKEEMYLNAPSYQFHKL